MDKDPNAERRARFERLFEAFYEPVLAYALRRTDRQRAHDATAETFLVAWRRLDDMPTDPLPWLIAVARRVLANRFRSDRRKNALARRLVSEAMARHEHPADPGDKVSEQDDMVTALDRLTDEDREILMLVAWEGLSNERAAQVLRMSPEAFSVRLHRARKRLANEIATLEGPSPLSGRVEPPEDRKDAR